MPDSIFLFQIQHYACSAQWLSPAGILLCVFTGLGSFVWMRKEIVSRERSSSWLQELNAPRDLNSLLALAYGSSMPMGQSLRVLAGKKWLQTRFGLELTGHQESRSDKTAILSYCFILQCSWSDWPMIPEVSRKMRAMVAALTWDTFPLCERLKACSNCSFGPSLRWGLGEPLLHSLHAAFCLTGAGCENFPF